MSIIIMNSISFRDFKRRVAYDFRVPYEALEEGVFELFQESVAIKLNKNEYIEMQMRMPRASLVGMHSLKETAYYFVQIRKSLWDFFGLVVQLCAEHGILPAVLRGCSRIGKGFSKLDPKSGELCLFFQGLILRKQRQQGFNEEDILALIADKKCFCKKFRCKYRVGWFSRKRGTCSIAGVQMKQLCYQLKAKDIFAQGEANAWIISL